MPEKRLCIDHPYTHMLLKTTTVYGHIFRVQILSTILDWVGKFAMA